MALVKCKECGSEGSTSAAGSLKGGVKPPKRTSLLTGLALFFGIAVGGTAMSAPSTGSASASKAPTSKQAEQRAQALAALQITEVDWHSGGFNNIMMLNATVQNSGKRDVKDIKVVCDHLSNGETKIDSNSGTIYGPFPAGKSKSIHEFDMGVFHDQAKGTNCSIVDATPATKRWGRASR
ncbi:MAG TPA: hypothetical protein VGK95_02395 [Caldimonas sp.]|jgi:hypothetical protein